MRSRDPALGSRRLGQSGVLRAKRFHTLRPSPAFVLPARPRRLPRGHEVALARADEMRLADYLIERFRPQQIRQWCRRIPAPEQIIH